MARTEQGEGTLGPEPLQTSADRPLASGKLSSKSARIVFVWSKPHRDRRDRWLYEQGKTVFQGIAIHLLAYDVETLISKELSQGGWGKIAAVLLPEVTIFASFEGWREVRDFKKDQPPIL